MKKKLLCSLLFLIQGTFFINAQKLYLCRSFSANGEPDQAITQIDVFSSKDSVYFLYQDKGNLKASIIFITIDRFENNIYSLHDSTALIPDKSKTWIAYPYLFDTTGDFRISFLDEHKKILAKAFIHVYVAHHAPTIQFKPDYYAKSSIVIAGGIDDHEQPVNIASKFNLPAEGGFTGTVYIKNDQAIKTAQFIVFIDKMDQHGVYKTVERKMIDHVNRNSNTAYFSHTFQSPGAYKIFIDTKEGVFINTCYFELLTTEGKSVVPLSYGALNPSSKSASYYSSSKVIFATDASPDGDPINAATVFKRSLKGGNDITVIVQNDKAMNTSQLVVYIDKMNKDGKYIPYENKYYDYTATSANTFWFKFNFYEPGQYKVKIQTKALVWINTGYITIK